MTADPDPPAAALSGHSDGRRTSPPAPAWRDLFGLSGFRLRLARLQERHGWVPAAEGAYRKLLRRNPEHTPALVALGSLLMRQRRFGEAVEIWRRALEMHPDYASAAFQLSRALHRLGRLEEAVDTYVNVVALAPHHVKACVALEELGTRFLKQPEAGSFRPREKAIEIARTLAAFPGGGPRTAATGIARTIALQAVPIVLETPDAALEEFELALSLVPDLPEALRGAAACFERLGQFDKAIGILNELIRLQPGATEPSLQRDRLLALVEGPLRSSSVDFADRLNNEEKAAYLGRARRLIDKADAEGPLDPGERERILARARKLLGHEVPSLALDAGLERPTPEPRKAVLTPEQRKAILAWTRGLLVEADYPNLETLGSEQRQVLLSRARRMIDASDGGRADGALDLDNPAMLARARHLLSVLFNPERQLSRADLDALGPEERKVLLSQARRMIDASDGGRTDGASGLDNPAMLARARHLLSAPSNPERQLSQAGSAATVMADLERLLRSARDAYRDGDLEEAERAYHEVLSKRPGQVRALSGLARVYMRARRFAEAVEVLGALQRQQPESAEVKEMLARAFAQEGRFADAARLYGELNDLQPDNVDVLLALARVNRTLRNWPAARAAWSRLCELEPERIDTRLELAQACHRDGSDEQARVELGRLLERDPDNEAALKLLARVKLSADPAGALACWMRLAELQPDALDVRLQMARLQLRLGQTTDAETGFRALLAREPDNREALTSLSGILAKTNPAEARRLLSAWSEKAPDDVGAILVQAQLYVAMGDHQSAEVAFLKARQLQPDNIQMLTGLGRLYSAHKKLNEAVEVWSDLAERTPNAVEPRLQLARVLHIRRDPAVERILQAILQGEPEHREALRSLAQFYGRSASTVHRALEVWERLATLDPASVFPVVHRARVLEGAGRLDEAEAEFRRALARDPTHPMALTDLARFLRLHRRYAKAIQIYEAHLALEPDRIDLILGIGQCLDRLNRMQEALSSYEKALALEPENLTALGYRGRLLRTRGQVDDAIADFRKICRLNPLAADAWHELIFHLAGAEREAEALAAADEAEAALGSTPATWAILGRACAAALFDDRAIAYFERAVAAESDNASYPAELGFYHFRRGMLVSAFHHLLDSRDLDRRDVRVARRLFDVTSAMQVLGLDHVALSKDPCVAQEILVPERLFELVRHVADSQVRSYEPVPRRVVAISATLAPGGAERQLVTMLAGLSESGFNLDLSLYCTSLSPRFRRDFYLSALDGTGIDIVVPDVAQAVDYLQSPEVAPFAQIVRHFPEDMVAPIAFWLREFRRSRPQVVHAWQDLTSLMAVVAALLAGVPRIVLCCRSVRPDNPRRRLRRFMKEAYQAVLGHSSVVLSNNSRAGANDYADWLGLDPAQVEVVYNGIDFDRLDSSANLEETEAARGALGIPKGVPVLGGVFRMSEEKRPLLWIDVAVAVAARRPDAHFVVCGDGPMRDDMRSYATALGIGDRMHLPGAQANIGSWFKMMDVVMLTSRHEGLPNVLLEAQSLGVPVVAPDVGGMAEVVEQGVTGWTIKNADAGLLAERVLHCLIDREWRTVAIERAPHFVRERFGIETMLRRNLEVYGISP